MIYHGSLRNNVHCSNYIKHCKMVVILEGAITARKLRNLTMKTNHADCMMVVHIH
jgi:hypothetical protein